MLLLILGAIAAVGANWFMKRRGITGEYYYASSRQNQGRGWTPGTLLVTGVSPKPDATGEQYVTITGVINGPTVNEHVVYQRMAVDVDDWPTIGELIPVAYSPKNPDRWAFTRA
jgi:hypothetical protein